MNYYIRVCKKNTLNINLSNHTKLCSISNCILKDMREDSSNNDYYKLKTNLSIYVNYRLNMFKISDFDYILYDYGFDNAITNYKKNYKIINELSSYKLIYNLIYNNYFEIINTNETNAVDKITSYIIAKNNRNTYFKMLNIKREGDYLVKIINKELNNYNAKLVLNKILEKFIDKSIKIK